MAVAMVLQVKTALVSDFETPPNHGKGGAGRRLSARGAGHRSPATRGRAASAAGGAAPSAMGLTV
uniref:Uncharacterized protein n=1 Tax=Setaria viridis TaxID=4556 RepID=A0A4U6TZ21_SETVI|nr:hypothetical protein SEVIR_6G025933v2 [Setaria viridis]